MKSFFEICIFYDIGLYTLSYRIINDGFRISFGHVQRTVCTFVSLFLEFIRAKQPVNEISHMRTENLCPVSEISTIFTVYLGVELMIFRPVILNCDVSWVYAIHPFVVSNQSVCSVADINIEAICFQNEFLSDQAIWYRIAMIIVSKMICILNCSDCIIKDTEMIGWELAHFRSVKGIEQFLSCFRGIIFSAVVQLIDNIGNHFIEIIKAVECMSSQLFKNMCLNIFHAAFYSCFAGRLSGRRRKNNCVVKVFQIPECTVQNKLVFIVSCDCGFQIVWFQKPWNNSVNKTVCFLMSIGLDEYEAGDSNCCNKKCALARHPSSSSTQASLSPPQSI